MESTSVLTTAAEKKTEADYFSALTMSAAIIDSPGKIILNDVPIPKPGINEIVFEVEGCGVCASSIPLFEGREWFNYPVKPGNPGHETWGRVVDKGANVFNFKIGDRITALSYHGFARFDVAHHEEAIKLPEEINHVDFPGESLGCAMNIFRRSGIKKGQTVAIIGIGFLGATLIQLAKSEGAKVIAISKRPYSLQIASKCGADEIILMDDHWKIIEKVKEITNGEFCDRVIEATGKEWPLNLAGELTRERGRLIIAGFHQDGMRNINLQLWNWRGLDVINAHERDQRIYIQGMREAVDAVMSGRINPQILYSHHYKLEDIQSAFNHLIERPEGFIKGIVTI
jgi:threonine dehydrogenase-like Zn-dependent dehydrogenase